MNNTEHEGRDLFTGLLCDKKWHNMEGRYKQNKDKRGKTGRSGGKLWVYYDSMEDVIGTRASVRAVSEVASVSSNKSASTKTAVISPPSDSSDEENQEALASVSVAGTSELQVVPKRQRGRDCAPKWFGDFTKQHAQDTADWRERVSTMKRMTDLMEVWVKTTTGQKGTN